MKKLFINNQEAIIGEGVYFPFTYNICSVNEINIINVPSTKTVKIPVCAHNDELFGHIGVLTRLNMDLNGIPDIITPDADLYIKDEDNAYVLNEEDNSNIQLETQYYDNSKPSSYISFNQVKKCNYRLVNDSELISEGLLVINNVTKDYYEVTLYDDLVNLLEDLGDLSKDNSLKKIGLPANPSSVYYRKEFKCNKDTLEYLNNANTGIYPVVGIRKGDNDLDNKKLYCSNQNYETVLATLPEDCSSLQLKTFKSYEFNYAFPINNVLKTINDYKGNIIEVDPSLNTLFSNVCLLANAPKNGLGMPIKNSMSGLTETKIDSRDYSGKEPELLLTHNSKKIAIDNASNTLTLDVSISIAGLRNTLYGGYTVNGQYVSNFKYPFIPASRIITKQVIKVWLTNNYYRTVPISNIVNVMGANISFDSSNGVYSGITIRKKLTVNFDTLFKEVDPSLQAATVLHLSLENYIEGDKTWVLYNPYGTPIIYSAELFGDTSTLKEYSLKFRSNDMVDSEAIMPNVSIKDFILELAKKFNLDMFSEDGKIVITPKKYKAYNEPSGILEITGLNPVPNNYSKIRLSNALPKLDILDSYNAIYKKIYGEQIITTGYNIRENTLEGKLQSYTPILYNDINNFAYGAYCQYNNGGRSKQSDGVIEGVEDKITFCYLKVNNEPINISDDIMMEKNVKLNDFPDSAEFKFGHVDPTVISTIDGFTKSASHYNVNKYLTPSPYLFDDNGIITHSLEFSSPVVNYARITDAEYPENCTLYYRYFRNILIDRYNSNNHILSARMFINGKLDIYNIYNYMNSKYIVSSIKEYDPTTPGVYDVELMRVNNENNYINNIIL